MQRETVWETVLEGACEILEWVYYTGLYEMNIKLLVTVKSSSPSGSVRTTE